MDINVIETVIQKDMDEAPWVIERLKAHIVITFDGDHVLLPEPYLNTVVIEQGDFETYYNLRESIKNSTTMEIWSKIKASATIMEEMIMSAPPPDESQEN